MQTIELRASDLLFTQCVTGVIIIEMKIGGTPETTSSIKLRFGAQLVLALCLIDGTAGAISSERAPHYCFDRKATIVGTRGDDVLKGTKGRDVIVGLGGNDTLKGMGGRDFICGGPGGTRLSGRQGEDLMGGRGSDRLSGGRGHELLLGGDGADIVRGGPGPDDLADNTTNGRDKLYGEGGNDFIEAGVGKDLLVGGKGVDRLNGGPGQDRVRGGADGRPGYYDSGSWGNGGDWLHVVSNNELVVDLGRGFAKGSDIGRDDVLGVENIDGARSHRGADPSITIFGNEKENILFGGSNTDTVHGRGGDDCLSHVLGDDELNGGSGSDFFASGPLDLCQEIEANLIYPGAGGKGYEVDLPRGTVTTPHGEVIQIAGIEGAYGSDGLDEMVGDGKDNTFFGQIGSDVLSGNGGDDFLDGGQATDSVDGGAGTDECRNAETTLNCEN